VVGDPVAEVEETPPLVDDPVGVELVVEPDPIGE